MRLGVVLVLLAFLAGGSFESTTLAAPKSKGAASDKPIDAKAVVKRVAEFYRQKKTFQVEFTQKTSIRFGDTKNVLESQAKISAERPNRLAIRQEGAFPAVDVVSDGEQLTISMAVLKRYTQEAAPKSLDELLANPLIAGGGGGRGPLLEILMDDPYKTLMDGVTKDEYAGRDKIGDTEAHHVKFEQDQFDWGMWVATGDQPLVVQVAFDMKKSLAASGLDEEQLKDAQFSLLQSYKNWRFDKPLAADTFVFQPPEDAKKADSFFPGGGDDEPEVSPLLGKPAPDIEQELLDGGNFSLKEQRGKKIVILDFWATWCGPCVREMPLVAEVADKYRDKVALYCVNEGEESETIREFLDEKKLEVAVTLDSQSEAGTAYGV